MVVFCKPTITILSVTSEAGIDSFCLKTEVVSRRCFIDKESKAFTLKRRDYIGSGIDLGFHMEIDPNPSPFLCVCAQYDQQLHHHMMALQVQNQP